MRFFATFNSLTVFVFDRFLRRVSVSSKADHQSLFCVHALTLASQHLPTGSLSLHHIFSHIPLRVSHHMPVWPFAFTLPSDSQHFQTLSNTLRATHHIASQPSYSYSYLLISLLSSWFLPFFSFCHVFPLFVPSGVRFIDSTFRSILLGPRETLRKRAQQLIDKINSLSTEQDYEQFNTAIPRILLTLFALNGDTTSKWVFCMLCSFCMGFFFCILCSESVDYVTLIATKRGHGALFVSSVHFAMNVCVPFVWSSVVLPLCVMSCH